MQDIAKQKPGNKNGTEHTDKDLTHFESVNSLALFDRFNGRIAISLFNGIADGLHDKKTTESHISFPGSVFF